MRVRADMAWHRCVRVSASVDEAVGDAGLECPESTLERPLSVTSVPREYPVSTPREPLTNLE